MAAISIPGLDAGDPVPGVYAYINFGAGPASGSGVNRKTIIIANKLSTGSGVEDTQIYGPDTPVPCGTEGDIIALAGAGSEAHRMYRRFTQINTVTDLYFIFPTASAGTAASGTVVITNAATGSGTHRLYVGDEFVETSIASGDAAATIATAIAANVNAKTHWPVTASVSTATVTLTAKQKGPRGNWIRYQAMITSGITTTTSATSDAFLTSGATADSNTNALATILPKGFYRIVSAAEDATQLGALVTQVNTQALPITGIRQRVFAGSVDTLANATTIATGINAARAEILWSEKNPWTPAELAAYMAGFVALYEVAPNPFTNFAGSGATSATATTWKVPRSRVDSAAPTRAQIKSALNNGLSPIKVEANGATTLVNRITTRSLSGSTPDYRIRDSHKVTICDFFTDDLVNRTALFYGNKRIANDPPKGTPPPGPETVTPSQYRNTVLSLIDEYDSNGLLQNVSDIKRDTVVQRSVATPTRMEVRIPLATVDNLFQFGMEVAQVA